MGVPMADVAAEFVRIAGQSWCLVQTKPRNEKYSAQSCNAQGIFVYLPLITKVEIHNRSERKLFLPMFPGYFFARASFDELTALRRDKGVWRIQILTEAEEEGLLEDLKRVRESELLSENHELIVNPGLQVGDVVRFKAGPFKGQEVIVESRENIADVIVNLEFLGRSLTIRCRADELGR